MNLAALIQRAAEAVFTRMVWRGVVTGTSGNRVRVPRDGEAVGQLYPRLASYTPATNDEVLVVIGIVVGKVLR